MTRTIIYAVLIAACVAGGAVDARDGNWKHAVLAWLYAGANGVIFFWR